MANVIAVNYRTVKSGFIALLVSLILKNAHGGSSMNFVRQPSSCVPIPSDLTLCEDVGYNTMILPNLLNHESLDETRQQAHSFVPLLREKCHPNLQVFLCSLFAPVCLPPESAIQGPIRPCKSLCKSVERHCTPVLKHNNFDWPPMLNCSKFTDQEPCVSIPFESTVSTPLTTTRNTDNATSSGGSPSTTSSVTESNVCAPCGRTLATDSLHDNFCASEFVLKIRIKRVKVKKSKGIRKIVAEKKRRVVYKQGPLTRRDLKKLTLLVQGSKKCTCSIDSLKKKKKGKKNKDFYLIMGRKVDRKLLVTELHTWNKRNKILKKAGKRRFGADRCPSFGNTGLE